MTDIFLSYSSTDRERVRPIRDGLVDIGYGVFWDIEVPPGTNWDQFIRERISESRVVIVFWTSNSCSSLNVHQEAVIARDAGKLVPVLLEPLPAAKLPMGFYVVQAIDLARGRQANTTAPYELLLDAIKTRMAMTRDGAAQNAVVEDAKAVSDLQVVAERGDAAAWVELGYRHFIGSGVEKNSEEAVRLWLLAADQNHSGAQYRLGLSFEYGLGVTSDTHKAMRYYQLSSDNGYAEANYALGQRLWAGRNIRANRSEGVRLIRRAADQGHPEAQYHLALLHADDDGGYRDLAKAAELFDKAAAHGHAGALFRLSLFIRNGTAGMARDLKLALRLCRRAASRGSSEANAQLGILYLNGQDGVPENHEMARWFFETAADLGDTRGRYYLGTLIERGIAGFAADENAAVREYHLAAADGSQLALAALQRLGER
jgi:TPR repeat protein